MTEQVNSFDCLFFGAGYNGELIPVMGPFNGELQMRRKDIMKAQGDEAEANGPYAIDEKITFEVQQYAIGDFYYAVAVAEGAIPDYELVEARAASGMNPL
ncbi:hypothetical protein [Pantoea agglomerans]|uniref:hypothetical protein n=1 Tax=Enterobacter agglomerans TaxID=549 RepID=UPI003209FE30